MKKQTIHDIAKGKGERAKQAREMILLDTPNTRDRIIRIYVSSEEVLFEAKEGETAFRNIMKVINDETLRRKIRKTK